MIIYSHYIYIYMHEKISKSWELCIRMSKSVYQRLIIYLIVISELSNFTGSKKTKTWQSLKRNREKTSYGTPYFNFNFEKNIYIYYCASLKIFSKQIHKIYLFKRCTLNWRMLQNSKGLILFLQRPFLVTYDKLR